ncbi:unnamed protein product [Paramecium pentaurelia]|uniref:Uncharacterized protein n=1 Tax=Paramecium pentaurelia TaxID=43138 RepID=A0A8S1S2D9_9CILI|nr:unnamed protein product [Paramecium pentaurelia]
MIPKRTKIASLYEGSNTISLDDMETPQFNNTRRRVLTQIEEDQPKLVLPKIKLGNNHNNLQFINNNEKKFKLTGAKDAFFRPRQINKLPQIFQKQALKKNENNLSQPEIRELYSYNNNKASAYTLSIHD